MSGGPDRPKCDMAATERKSGGELARVCVWVWDRVRAMIFFPTFSESGIYRPTSQLKCGK